MRQSPSFRDVEKLSAYLDGQLKPSEKARLESRLLTEPELASILKDLRQTRGLLRQLPQRRAPRNFTLTPKMVGQKPPLPRTYPAFGFASALATLLLFLTFATNFMAPRLQPVAAPFPYGMGGGGGGADPELESQVIATAEAAQPAQEMPAAEAPAVPGTPTPAATEALPSTEDQARFEPTLGPSEKSGVQAEATGDTFAQQVPPEEPRTPAPLIGPSVQIMLAVIAVMSALVAFFLRNTAIRQWRAKTK
jgi:hypothetical protein